MKKTLLLSIALFFVSISGRSQNLWYNIEQNSYEKFEMILYQPPFKVEEVKVGEGFFSRIIVDDYHHSSTIGSPELPIAVRMIEIPLCENAKLKVTPGRFDIVDAADYGINYPLYPAQPSYAKSYTGPVEFQKSENIYTNNQFYANELVELEINGIFRNVNLATLYFSPIEYNPVTHQLKIYHSVKVEVTYENADIPATYEMKSLHGNNLFKSVKNQLINQLPSNTRTQNSDLPIKYLIVSHEMFRGHFDDFVEWKRSKGFLVEVAYTDDTNVGRTTSSISQFIKSKYTSATDENPAPTYTLLMGDIQQLPAFPGTTGDHVTDLYYFTWTNGDNIPDCYYGRMSAQTVEQLTAQIAKTLKYEKYEFEDPSFLGRAVLVAGTDSYWSQTHANGQANYLSNNYVNEDYGYTTIYKHLHDCSSQAAQIRSELSAGTGFANYTAHCSSAGWSEPAFETNHISALSNTNMYGLMIGNCCQSSKFDDNICFAEAITRAENKGAVAYIGGTNNTYWDEDYYWGVGLRSNINANPTYDATRLGAFDRLFHTHDEEFSEWHIASGAILSAGNFSVQASTSSRKLYYWEIYSLMGDPSLMPYLAIPQEMEVDIPDFITLGETTMEVNVAPYAYVALLQNDNLLATAFADENGAASLEFDPIDSPDELTIAASAQNYIHHFHTTTPLTADGSYVYAAAMALTDDATLKSGGHHDWNLTVKNIGNAMAEGVYVKLSTSSTHILLLTDSVWIGDVAINQEIELQNVFDVWVSDITVDQEIIPVTTTIYDVQGEMSAKNIRYKVAAPKLQVANYTTEEHVGNGNGTIEAGEKVKVTINGRNSGHLAAQHVQSMLISRYTLATVDNSILAVDLLPVNEQMSFDFFVQLADDIESPSFLPLYYKMIADGKEFYDTIYLPVGLLTEDFESNSFDENEWEHSTYPWVTTSVNPHSGTYCAKSANNLNNNRSSELNITLNLLFDDEISYFRKVSSEAGYDLFTFLIDGNPMEELSGTVNWGYASFPVTAGEHTFTFKYSKDVSQRSGSDCAWIDDIYLPGQAPIIQNDKDTDFPAGVVNITPDYKVNLYPNPAYHTLKITSDQELDKMEIIDIHGRLLKVISKEDKFSTTVTVSDLADGVYFIRIILENNDIIVKKFIKQ